MSLVYPNIRLSEVIEENTSLIPVIHRFGIHLGLGDSTVQEICEQYNLHTDFFLTMINTFLNEDYFPQKKLLGFHTSQIVDYLTKTNHYYQRHQLPNIERHLRSFLSMSDPDNNALSMIEKIFTSFKDILLRRIKNDEKEWFPYCISLSNPLKDVVFALDNNSEDADDCIEALLTDLKLIMIKHLSGEYDENLCHAVIFAISLLAKDIKQHNRIRFRILQPMVEGMENKGQ
ncbi:MAG: helix-turn-helix transcriptional regulator [Tannerella sp.]|jgi:regulator of cell morphogenesis and NO signaling|nr:helix-turn-helix transcriptional regulator [Tannerella sp.]